MVTRWTSLMIGLQAPKLLFLVRINLHLRNCFGESRYKVLLSDISKILNISHCLLSGGTTTLVDLVMPERGENLDRASKLINIVMDIFTFMTMWLQLSTSEHLDRHLHILTLWHQVTAWWMRSTYGKNLGKTLLAVTLLLLSLSPRLMIRQGEPNS